MAELPIDTVLPALRGALSAGPAAILQAPPGSGKTTRVPLALLGEAWLEGRRIVMLEPRRLATRAAAGWMARQLGERVGGTVGYRIRRDTRVGPTTRIEVVTEGVLTRMIQHDPTLDGVGLVIFDEFHERSLHGDLGLALTLHSRNLLRNDLRVLIMSATIDTGAIATLLGGAPVIAGEGRAHAIETRYTPPRAGISVEAAVVGRVRDVLTGEAGDILVFLPGTGEIRRVASMLADSGLAPSVRVAPLYGDLSQEAQDAAIQPSPAGARKVVLATAIAETSLTIEGVRVVIDSGLARVPRFSPRTGMTRLETTKVSAASAEQRRGRAGRVGPGICYRLWPEGEQRELRPREVPEMLEADLAPLALELAEAGIPDPNELQWLDPPPPAALSQARELLMQLGALDGAGRITAHGGRMAEFGLHPRLAHMLLRADALGFGVLACDLAALLGERDILRREGSVPDADLRTRVEALRRGDGSADPGAVHRVRAEARLLRERLGAPAAKSSAAEVEAAGLVLAFAYPDRIGQRRPGQSGRFLLRAGQGAHFAEPQALAEADYIVAPELDGRPRESRIFLAAPVTLEEIEEQFGDQIELEEVVQWDESAEAVVSRRRERLGALVLRDAPLRDPDPDAVKAALLDGLARRGVDALPWSEAARGLMARLRFLHRRDPAWPDVSFEALEATLPDWLGPYLDGVRRRDDVARLDLAGALLARLTWAQRSVLDELAPTHLVVPSGSRVSIDYGDPDAPVLAVRLQEVFGLVETPRIAGGAVPITLHLLSPARRPVQVTRDLAGFWRTTYFEVKKDLKGRYPRHYWPDDPLQATPTRRVRPADRPPSG